MSKYIGKRVSYPCAGECNQQITLNKKCLELPDGRVFCQYCRVVQELVIATALANIVRIVSSQAK